MTKRGFYFRRIGVYGPGREPAEVDLRDGLNVIAGASDTGKSYLLSLFDFVLGSSGEPHHIAESTGYQSVRAEIVIRATGYVVEIERPLAGGNVTLRERNGIAGETKETVVSSRHGPIGSLSARLLETSGFKAEKIRKNQDGETRSLSFRDLAFLTVVSETRIMSEEPPYLSGVPTERTAETEIFRFVITGKNKEVGTTPQTKASRLEAAAQLKLVESMMDAAEARVKTLQLNPAEIERQLAEVARAHGAKLESHSLVQRSLAEAEKARREAATAARHLDGRLATSEGLLARYSLLQDHYSSDIARLEAIGEASVRLEQLESVNCPYCGAAPESHRPEVLLQHRTALDVRLSAQAERQKIEILRRDLAVVVETVQADAARYRREYEASLALQERLEREIEERLSPVVLASARELQLLTDSRAKLERAATWVDQLRDLDMKAVSLRENAKPAAKGKTSSAKKGMTGELKEFTSTVEALLKSWKYAQADGLVFSEVDGDILVEGQARASHGKGVRALTCSAFLIGLMRHCMTNDLPHPTTVVLDSPLVAYKQPDGLLIREAGVKDEFYRSIAAESTDSQVIVLENEDPPADVQRKIAYHHFTKSNTGRYGFFPTLH